MKKRAIVLLAFTAALTAVSCQKEAMKEAESTPTGKGMTINAVSEGIGADVKADLAYKYDVIWKMGDEICVRNSQKSVGFTLVDGAGTTKGTFSSTGGDISGEVEGFYPASVANLIWPAGQQNNHVPPMYCKKTLSSTQNQTFNFASLGSVLQLNFNSTTAGIVLKSIEVKADEAMSGAFTIENGQAKVSQPEGDKPGITLDLGEGVALGTSAKKFNLAVPADEYNNLTITFIAKDGRKCIIHATKPQSIEYNTVNTLAVSGEFKAGLPADALPGVFTVGKGADGKAGTEDDVQVHFSQGNLWYGKVGDAQTATFQFENKQYEFHGYDSGNDIWGLFGWVGASSTTFNSSPEIYGVSTSTTEADYGNSATDALKKDWGTAIDDKDTWRTLSAAEWQYLFNDRTMANGGARYENLTSSGITVKSVIFRGVVIFPDNFTEQADWKTKYTTWEALNNAGIVFLPATGYRYGSSIFDVGSYGYYWSSSALDESNAYSVGFSISVVNPGYSDGRNYGASVRLITECQ